MIGMDLSGPETDPEWTVNGSLPRIDLSSSGVIDNKIGVLYVRDNVQAVGRTGSLNFDFLATILNS